MKSVNAHAIEDRIARIYDTNLGAQGSPKEIKKAVGELSKAAGKRDPSTGSGADLIRDLKGGRK